MRSVRRLFAAIASAAVSAAMVSVAQPASAATVPWGTLLVAGSTWAGPYASLGNLNVYSNGDGNQDVAGPYGWEYECFELAARWAQIAYGDPHNGWDAYYAYQMYDTGPYQTPAFLQRPNGGAWMPEFGDLLVFNRTSFDPSGHVAVVTAVGYGHVDIVEQNWGDPDPTGYASLPIGGDLNGRWDPTYMPARWGLPVRGWLHSTVAPDMRTGTVGAEGSLSLPSASPSTGAAPSEPPPSGTPRSGPRVSPTPAPTGVPATGTVGSAPAWSDPGTPKPPPPADYTFGAQFLPTGGVAPGTAPALHFQPPATPPSAGPASTPSDRPHPGAATLPPAQAGNPAIQ